MDPHKILGKILVSKLVSVFSEYRNLYHYSQEVVIANELSAHGDYKQTGLTGQLVFRPNEGVT